MTAVWEVPGRPAGEILLEEQADAALRDAMRPEGLESMDDEVKAIALGSECRPVGWAAAIAAAKNEGELWAQTDSMLDKTDDILKGVDFGWE